MSNPRGSNSFPVGHTEQANNFVSSNLSAHSLAISEAIKFISVPFFFELYNFNLHLEPPKEFVRINLNSASIKSV